MVVGVKMHERTMNKMRTMTAREYRGEDSVAVVIDIKQHHHGSAEWVRNQEVSVSV